ncbi:MAG TPA: hypothetical protein ENN42_02290 [Thioalkalivibrio sp.]|nr:hypothetical protein [Thioalkalivibrio sp.]
MSGLLIVALLAPLLLAVVGGWRPAARLAPWAPLPALLLAVAAPDDTVLELPWLLLGTQLGLDETGRVFLLLTALVWLLAGWFARGYLAGDPRQVRFRGYFLVTQAGNLALCLALDAGSFYLGFSLMTFAAYGLVVHSGSTEARRAGTIYLVMAVLGEAALLAGILLAVQAGGGGDLNFEALTRLPLGLPAVTLLVLGFGVKVGLPLLHMWLPLAHPVAPVPASAVLSGVMLKAGVLGWLRFLPLGTQALPEAGTALMTAGLVGMFFGVVAGLAQRDPKVLLAYSSISQMGFLALAVGAGMAAPTAWPQLWPAVALYALHHALAKSALFLGVGVVDRRGARPLVLVALALPALALAGAPLTGGALAKLELKTGLASLSPPWLDVIALLLPLAAVGTALLMLRLLVLVTGRPASDGERRGLLVPWAALLLAGLILPWWLAGAPGKALGLGALVDSSWPLAAAFALWLLARAWRGGWPVIPPGDVVAVPERLLVRLLESWRRWQPPVIAARWRGVDGQRLRQWERVLGAWPLAAALWLVLLMGGILAMLRA